MHHLKLFTARKKKMEGTVNLESKDNHNLIKDNSHVEWITPFSFKERNNLFSKVINYFFIFYERIPFFFFSVNVKKLIVKVAILHVI